MNICAINFKRLPMIRTIAIFVFSGLILTSCGTGKKLESANAQIADLNNQLAAAKSRQSESEKLVTDLQKANEINSRDAADCRAAKEQLRQKKEKLDRELAARGTSFEELNARAEKAVGNLRAAGCEVSYENGRFHVIIPDEYNFKPGSVRVGAKAREALNVVAQVMYDNPGVSAIIVGHSDTVSVKGIADNWSVSTERANAVVRVLEDVYNINPKRLTAAGSSKFNPRASNATEEGRRLNRRIEIYINPHRERIWALLEE
jgi:chemotaxis protein MotB